MSTTQKTHKLAVTAMLAAAATVLMALDFPSAVRLCAW